MSSPSAVAQLARRLKTYWPLFAGDDMPELVLLLASDLAEYADADLAAAWPILLEQRREFAEQYRGRVPDIGNVLEACRAARRARRGRERERYRRVEAAWYTSPEAVELRRAAVDAAAIGRMNAARERWIHDRLEGQR
jgi:hypothetical protein